MCKCSIDAGPVLSNCDHLVPQDLIHDAAYLSEGPRPKKLPFPPVGGGSH